MRSHSSQETSSVILLNDLKRSMRGRCKCVRETAKDSEKTRKTLEETQKTQEINVWEMPHEKLLGRTWVSNPATRKDRAARTWDVFWYWSKIPVLFEIIVQIKQKRGTGVKTPSPRSFWCGQRVREDARDSEKTRKTLEETQEINVWEMSTCERRLTHELRWRRIIWKNYLRIAHELR